MAVLKEKVTEACTGAIKHLVLKLPRDPGFRFSNGESMMGIEHEGKK